MALAETTLSSAVAIGDRSIVVASAASISAGRIIQIDGEFLRATQDYTSGTTVNVLRGQNGTAAAAHVSSARVVHGDAQDFATAIGVVTTVSFTPTTKRIAYATTATLDLPTPGQNLFVVSHGSAFTLTVPVPTKDLDGCEITFTGAAGAAYVYEFTGGLGGASTNYETITFNATGAPVFKVVAYNETWRMLLGVAVTGTVTNVTASLG